VQKKTFHSYRFVIAPETIGAITYLAKNEKTMKKLDGGFILTCVAGPGRFGYKKTFVDNHEIDKIVLDTFDESNVDFILYPFVPNGSDERQYSSPFFRIPIGIVSKDKYHEYEFYHTSKDNLDFIKIKYLFQTFELYMKIFSKLEKKSSSDFIKLKKPNSKRKNLTNEHYFLSLNPWCEPMLHKRGLYPTTGGTLRQKTFSSKEKNLKTDELLLSNNEQEIKTQITKIDEILWLLFYSDGDHSIEDIAQKTGLSSDSLLVCAKNLEKTNLLKAI